MLAYFCHSTYLGKNNLSSLTRRIGTHEQTLFVNRLRMGGEWIKRFSSRWPTYYFVVT